MNRLSDRESGLRVSTLHRIDRSVRALFGRRYSSDTITGEHTSSPNVASGRATLALTLLLALYGGVMGSFGIWDGIVTGDELLQIIYSACKLPLLIGLTFALSLPALIAFYALAGVADDLREVIRLMTRTQLAFALVLIGLSPYTLLLYASSGHYSSTILFNGALFGVAAFIRHRVLHRSSAELIRRNPRHRLLLRIWFLLNTLVGIQLGWVLRPFVGVPGADTAFIRPDSWSNAYLALADILSSLIADIS